MEQREALFDRLVRNFLIARRDVEFLRRNTDRRIKMIELTDKGWAVWAELLDELTSDGSSELARLSDEERETLACLLRKVTQFHVTDIGARCTSHITGQTVVQRYRRECR